MNIEGSTVNKTSELLNAAATAQQVRFTGNTAFQSHLQTLKVNSNSEDASGAAKTSVAKEEDKSSTSQAKTEKQEENKNVKNAETSSNEKTSQSDLKHENQANNEAQGQNSQGQSQNNQNGQGAQSEMLTEEIISMMQQNGKLGEVEGLQNAYFVSGISEEVFTSAPAVDYSKFSMSDEDAMFFANLVKNTEMSMQNIASEFQKALEVSELKNVQKTAQISSVLLEALSESMKTGKAFRIDFDKDVSVVMRVDKDGNLSANFIPGDKAVEAYLRNNIPYLKQRFDEQNLQYTELTYSKYKRQSQDEKRNNKENKNE